MKMQHAKMQRCKDAKMQRCKDAKMHGDLAHDNAMQTKNACGDMPGHDTSETRPAWMS
jgi:hypothetical protein